MILISGAIGTVRGEAAEVEPGVSDARGRLPPVAQAEGDRRLVTQSSY
jgi:hypothetical protein